jgi:hypothetical protein
LSIYDDIEILKAGDHTVTLARDGRAVTFQYRSIKFWDRWRKAKDDAVRLRLCKELLLSPSDLDDVLDLLAFLNKWSREEMAELTAAWNERSGSYLA